MLGTAVDVTITHASGLSRTYAFGLAGQVPLAQEVSRKSSSAAAGDLFAQVAISDDTMVVGAPGDAPGGAAYVFQRVDRTWTEIARLTAAVPAAGDGFGSSVAIDGDTLAIGVPGDDGIADNAGAVHVFVRSGPGWVLQATLKSNPVTAEDRVGTAVAISGATLIAGAPNEDTAQVDSGAAFVFVRGGVWTQQARLKAALPRAADQFGKTVSISGASAIVGAPMEDGSGTGVDPDRELLQAQLRRRQYSSPIRHVVAAGLPEGHQQQRWRSVRAARSRSPPTAPPSERRRGQRWLPVGQQPHQPAARPTCSLAAARRGRSTLTEGVNTHANARFGLASRSIAHSLLVGARGRPPSATGSRGARITGRVQRRRVPLSPDRRVVAAALRQGVQHGDAQPLRREPDDRRRHVRGRCPESADHGRSPGRGVRVPLSEPLPQEPAQRIAELCPPGLDRMASAVAVVVHVTTGLLERHARPFDTFDI